MILIVRPGRAKAERGIIYIWEGKEALKRQTNEMVLDGEGEKADYVVTNNLHFTQDNLKNRKTHLERK